MNLQEVLQHRTNCLIHGLPLQLQTMQPGPFLVDCMSDGVKIVIREVTGKRDQFHKLFLYNDGTYKREGGIEIANPHSTIYMISCCPTCAKTTILKPRDVGITTIENILVNHHYYTFTIYAYEGEDKYSCKMGTEVIKYTRDSKFYHATMYMEDGSASFKMGSCEVGQSIQHMLEGVMHLDLPKFDPARIASVDQLVNKIKLYNLFS